MRHKLLATCISFLMTFGAHSAGGDQPIVVLRGDLPTEIAPHHSGNVYAPEIHRFDGKLWMWYGGQGKDGHDRIHLAESTDGINWQKLGIAIDNEAANHVNDPSVVRVNNQWWMFYTVAEKNEQDEIAAASSKDGRTWTKHGVVLGAGNGNTWDSGKVGRPSVLFQDGKFHMWYDGQPSGLAGQFGDQLARTVRIQGRAVGYAESIDGLHWQRRNAPVFHNGAGAVHVVQHQLRYLMVYESGRGTRWADSKTLFDWQDQGFLVSLSGETSESFGHVTPFLFVADSELTLYYGAAARQTWDGNSIATIKVKLP